MTEGSGIAVVRKFYDSFVDRNLEAVVATLSDDLDWRESEKFLLGDPNPYLSPAAVVDGVFSRIAKEFQDYQAGPTKLIGAGDVVVAVGRSKGIMAATGKPFDAQYMHVVRVAGGKSSDGTGGGQAFRTCPQRRPDRRRNRQASGP